MIDSLRSCEEYQHYLQEKEKIQKFPELKASIYRLREINLLIQEVTDPETEEHLRAEYDHLSADIRIRDFMQAETDYCRLFQEIEEVMASELDL
ncbi:MAG: YlbF family regulator [Lachnospiraceae bacterium]|nr:YlbF family regulator [Lachnospiraceae bacterium]